jgi:hypothetical protein
LRSFFYSRRKRFAVSQPDERQVAEHRFNAIDGDGDGAISLHEAHAYAKIAPPAAGDRMPNWFSAMDANGNGRIDPAEFDPTLE